MFKNDASEFVYTRTYSRWIEAIKKRENWPETVKRYIQFLFEERGHLIPKKVLDKIEKYMLSFDVMPSMRAVWAAGEAAKQENLTLYNCSFQQINKIDSFSECLYILMCGTGYGFSVEQNEIEKLPSIPKIDNNGNGTFIIEDSRIGWANSIKQLMHSLYDGKDLEFDYTYLRPKGSRLVTMGGRSGGPVPLINLHSFIKEMFNKAQGRKLTSLECHDICNKIAEIVVVGGVRRSSQISLSDLNDEFMRNAKVGNFPIHRYMANNSAIYYEKPNAPEFLKEWSTLALSGTGERGIFNLKSARDRSPQRRKTELIQGVNPCCEILLRNEQLCNLSEVVIRKDDDLDSLFDKVETATWIGVIQSTFTDFKFLNNNWKQNCEEERLLGVSLTGQMDNIELVTKDVLKALKIKAIKVAKHASMKMNINIPSAITCIKPSGTVSQLVDSSSGLHTRYSDYYIRRYRISTNDPLFQMLKDQKVPVYPEVGQDEQTATTWVLEFPIKSPKGSITRNKMTALEQLEHYKLLQNYWCEHSASATIYVNDNEWFEVGNWVYQNWDYINGVSFLPYDGGKYKLAPYEEITKEKYEKLVDKFPKIDYSQLTKYELEDQTEGAKALACVAGVCEI
jgi:ribonucleoside-diphosphate reductase alpha chain